MQTANYKNIELSILDLIYENQERCPDCILKVIHLDKVIGSRVNILVNISYLNQSINTIRYKIYYLKYNVINLNEKDFIMIKNNVNKKIRNFKNII